jgi:hypothetical protein
VPLDGGNESLIWLNVVIVFVLAIAALAKYLFVRERGSPFDEALTVFSARRLTAPLWRELREIDRLMPIVVETEQILNRPNSLLRSRAQISDGSWSRFLRTRRKHLHCYTKALPYLRIIEWE